MGYLLLETAGRNFPTYFVLVYVVGFIAAVSIGSIAWYNSRRPPGWESAEKPDFIPEMDVKSKNNEEKSE